MSGKISVKAHLRRGKVVHQHLRRLKNREGVYFHGTRSTFLQSIGEKGIVASSWRKGTLKGAVFLHRNAGIAKKYAKTDLILGKRSGTPIVLKIKLPRHVRVLVKPDVSPGGVRLHQTVKPSWIKRVYTLR